MSIERKSYPVADLKVSEEPGIIEAIVSVFNNVDAGKEIVRPGFFEKSIQKKLPKGVWAHDWKQPIAKTLEAKELHPGDPQLPAHLFTLGGTYIKGQFNLDTQRGREAYSDIKFGIVDEFSIGYSVLKDGKDKETGARELIEGDWKEWSPVLVGMNDQTALISIKSDEETKTVMRCKPEDMEPGKPWCLYSQDGGKLLGRHATREECVAQEQAIEANKPKSLSEDQIQEVLTAGDDQFYLKVIAASESFESFDKAALAALKKFIENMQRNHEARVKEGRVLSSSNRSTVQACRDTATALIADLDALLAMSEPKPKEKEIGVDALRTQSLRMQSLAIRALA
jgi:HK97 family phage prohead protease